MKALSISLVSLTVCGAVAFTALAQSDLPEGKGRDETASMCGSCHGLELITQSRQSKSGWAQTTDDMVGRGAQGTDEQIALVINYLATHFGKPVNVNKADSKQLQDGLSLAAKDADAIVSYRAGKGDFKNLDDLLKVPGIDAAALKEQTANIEF